MRNGSEWYKREPVSYLGGVQGMTAREHAVYSIVLDLIYVHGGAINNDPKWIAGWISDMGSAAVKRTIESLVERGKLAIEDGQITQKRAKNEAKTKEKLRENAQKTGKKGGKKSADLRRQAKENNDLPEGCATSENQPEKRREEYSIDTSSLRSEVSIHGDGGGAREASPENPEPEKADLQPILEAMGFPDGVVGPSKIIGSPADRAEVQRWLDLPGMTMGIITAEIRRIAVQRQSDPPQTVRYFRQPMQRLSGQITAGALDPIKPIGASGGDQSRRDWMNININPDDYDDDGNRIRSTSREGSSQ